MNDAHLKRIQKDVDEMNKVFDLRNDEGDKTDPPSTDPPEELKTDPPATDPPAGDETTPPKTDAPKTQPPSTDPPEDKDEIIRKLREKLAEGKDDVPKTKAPKTKPPTTDAPIQDIDFVGDLDLENLSENKEEANKLFNKIFKEAAKVKGVQQGPDLMAAIPALVTAITGLQKATETFYEENPDLKPFMKVVGLTFEELAEKNPDKKYDELINDVAPLVRQKLELPEPKKKGKETPPRLPRRKAKAGRVPDNQEPESTQSQIDEMNKTLGR